MSWSFVQATSSGHVGASTSLAYGSDVASGNLLVVAVSTFQTSTVSISDSQGNTWQQSGPYSNNGSRDHVSIWYATAKSSGANTVTVTPSASDFTGLSVLEYSYPGATFSVDGSVTNNGNTNPVSSGSIPVNGTGELAIVAFAQGNLNDAWTAGSGFTNRTSEPNGSSFEALYVDDDFPVSSAVDDSGSLAAADAWTALGVSFKATVSSGGAGSFIGGDMGHCIGF